MQKEDQILEMLEHIIGTQGEHGKKLDEHSKKLDKHQDILDNHSATLQEHGQILRALLSGQETLKAEVDGMKLSNAREFGDIKEEQRNISTKFELLREDTWANKVNIHRMKNTMGMN